MWTIVPFRIVAVLIAGVYALNDWNEPCTFGECHYDLDSDGSSGTLKMWGSHKVISDITPAAGWHIFECKEHGLEQFVRMVCVSESAPCSHLFSHSGPEGKIVRLPPSCGRNPFARVASLRVSHEPMPLTLASKLRKRDGQVPEVYNLVLDVKFSDVNPKHGPIRFAIQAATIPNTDTYIDTHLPLHKRSGRKIQRSHEDIVARASATVKRNILEAFKHRFDTGIQTVVNASRKAVDNAKDDIDKDIHKADSEIRKGIHKVEGDIRKDVHAVDNAVHKAEVDIPKDFHDVVNATEHPKATFESAVNGTKNLVQEAKKLSNFTKTIHFSPKLDGRNITLLKQTFNCPGPPPRYPGFQVDLNPNGKINGTVGVVASGTLFPPHVEKFQIIARLEADVNAVLTIVAELTVVYDSGQHKIFEFPLAGIEFPGILSLGPQFQLFVKARMLFDIVVGTRLNIGFQVHNLVFEFPKTQPTPEPDIEMKNGSFNLTSTPFVRGAVQGDVHLIPTLAFGLDFLGKFQTTLNFQVDMMLVQYLRVEQLAKTQNIKPRKFSETEPGSSNVVFDVKGLLHDMPLVAKSVAELALRFWHGSDPSNMEITKYSGAAHPTLPSLRRRSAPGPAPWPGGTGPLSHDGSTEGPATDACLETFFIAELVIAAVEAFWKLDTNSQIVPWRRVDTLDMLCVGTLQPNGSYSSVNKILDNLNNMNSHVFRRSEGTSSESSVLGHKCSITMGMGFMASTGGDAIGTNYAGFGLSHTKV